MKQQRRFTRYPIVNGDIIARTIYGLDVTILNIGLLGATVSHTKQLGTGTDFLLVVHTDAASFDLNAEVVWQKLSGYQKNPAGESIPYYTSGLKFIDLLTPKGNQLKDFLLEGRDSAETRLTSRIFRITETVKASLMEFMSCPIRNLSSGGMLIERRTFLKPNEKLPIEISVPGESHLLVRGRVACCQEHVDSSGPYYDVGIEFAEISDTDRRNLNELVDTLSRQ